MWLLYDAVFDPPRHELVGSLAGGRAELAGRWVAQVPLPSRTSGPVQLELVFANRGVLTASGTAFACRVDGAPRFTESLAC